MLFRASNVIRYSLLSKLVPPAEPALSAVERAAPQFDVRCCMFDVMSSLVCLLLFFAKQTQFTNRPNKRSFCYNKELQRNTTFQTPQKQTQNKPNLLKNPKHNIVIPAQAGTQSYSSSMINSYVLCPLAPLSLCPFLSNLLDHLCVYSIIPAYRIFTELIINGIRSLDGNWCN